MSKNTCHYFAYGSNLHPERLRQRAPSSVAVETAVLPNHRLAFHKRGADGSGKCNVYYTGDPQDRVFGVIYQLHRADRKTLDEIEGVGRGYEAVSLQVLVRNAMREVYGYIAQSSHVDESLRPFSWYKDFVTHGALHHDLPSTYIDHLHAVEAVIDDNSQRHDLNMAILRALSAPRRDDI